MDKKKFLAFNLPYGVKGIDGNGDVSELIAFDKRGYFCTDLDLNDNEDEMHVLDGNFKPILHTLTDLTKEIEHNRKKFVPIIELAKMCWKKTEKPDFKIQSLKNNTVFIAFPDKLNVFGYDSNTKSFFGAINGESTSVINQLDLFQKLI